MLMLSSSSSLWYLVLCTIFFHQTSSSSLYDANCGAIIPSVAPSALNLYSDALNLTIDRGEFFTSDGLSFEGTNFSSVKPHPQSFYISTGLGYRTSQKNIYKVNANLSFGYPPGQPSYSVEGFWSTSSGTLCMVGSVSNPNSSTIALQLNGLKDSYTFKDLIYGQIWNTSNPSSSGSLLIFPSVSSYTVIPSAAKSEFDAPFNQSRSLESIRSFSDSITPYPDLIEFEFVKTCETTKNCVRYYKQYPINRPMLMSLTVLSYSEDHVRFRLEILSTEYSSYGLGGSLIAEGVWVPTKRHLYFVACRILASDNKYQLDDCSVRMNMRFPSVWSLGHMDKYDGYMWSIKNGSDPSYFDPVRFRLRIKGDEYLFEGYTYNYTYTMIDKAVQQCPKFNSVPSSGKYPDGKTGDLSFSRYYDGLVKYSDHISGTPLFVNGTKYFYDAIRSTVNVTYRIDFSSYSTLGWKSRFKQIIAEGTYDPKTGKMCMVGCGTFVTEEVDYGKGSDSEDCEIVVSVQFPSIGSSEIVSVVINSTRSGGDSWFPTIDLRLSIGTKGRIGAEITMAVIVWSVYVLLCSYNF